MRTFVFAAILASASVGIACGVADDADPVVNDSPTPASEPTTGEAPKVDAGAATPAVTSCSSPLPALSCSMVASAPTEPSKIDAFVKSAAIPLRCGEEPAVWDVEPLVELYGAQKIFMMGEVHGTNEIGIMSSIVARQLATKKLVNVIAFEIPMDFGGALDRYVQTGNDPVAARLLELLAPNMFGNILTRTARDLVLEGTPIHVVGVDTPSRPEPAIAAIREIATKLTTQSATVLDTLPTTIEQPSTSEERANVAAYFDHIIASKEIVCTELTAADCERLIAMTHALWVSTFELDREDEELWFSRREEVIYYNMKSAIASPTTRMYLHMGAAHTNKLEFSAGSRMAHEYPLTKDKVFSVAPAFGDGSVIFYGEERSVPGGPTLLTSALTDTPRHPVFVSTTRPTASCEANPFGAEIEGEVAGGLRGETYDGYIHYGLLTSERSPEKTSFTPPAGSAAGERGTTSVPADSVQRFLDHRMRVDANERAVRSRRAQQNHLGPRRP